MVMGYGDDTPKHEKPDYDLESATGSVQPTPAPRGGVSEVSPELVENSKFGIPWKSIIGFFTVFIGQLLARATVDGVAVLPEDLKGWVTLVGGSFVAAGVIWLKGNTYTVDQAQQKLDTAVKRAST